MRFFVSLLALALVPQTGLAVNLWFSKPALPVPGCVTSLLRSFDHRWKALRGKTPAALPYPIRLADAEEAWLAALEANPSDRVLALFYADWLEEHGFGTRARYVRLMAWMELWTGPSHVQPYQDMWRESQSLEWSTPPTSTEPLQGRVHCLQSRDGACWSTQTTPALFGEYGAGIVSAAPWLRELTLRRGYGEEPSRSFPRPMHWRAATQNDSLAHFSRLSFVLDGMDLHTQMPLGSSRRGRANASAFVAGLRARRMPLAAKSVSVAFTYPIDTWQPEMAVVESLLSAAPEMTVLEAVVPAVVLLPMWALSSAPRHSQLRYLTVGIPDERAHGVLTAAMVQEFFRAPIGEALESLHLVGDVPATSLEPIFEGNAGVQLRELEVPGYPVSARELNLLARRGGEKTFRLAAAEPDFEEHFERAATQRGAFLDAVANFHARYGESSLTIVPRPTNVPAIE